ncbi:hypothetical protein EYF80_008803 [Liparis tanakae]|uniref:Uncharacterized protein n=1 Tax=Liparis tanakae TaxID=230148 RepID=A0A4Z2IT77_9TELE|nr:hypothetical protein EYF80_008803 [Liparis tanakae]
MRRGAASGPRASCWPAGLVLDRGPRVGPRASCWPAGLVLDRGASHGAAGVVVTPEDSFLTADQTTKYTKEQEEEQEEEEPDPPDRSVLSEQSSPSLVFCTSFNTTNQQHIVFSSGVPAAAQTRLSSSENMKPGASSGTAAGWRSGVRSNDAPQNET